MIDITNLSTRELLDLKKQVQERLNKLSGALQPETSIDELIALFNQKCRDTDLDLFMKTIETKDGIVLQIEDVLDVFYLSEPEHE